ncbi:hypothetical protein TRFO_27351 [Tritrichomonas foetus]|uniref:Non-structural maintenance of chromosomes element 4 n=1 Tax=Tritrichomonas foetus TaxID=1144522 RepID=A0A1J4K0X5_9EUKA|nr:hypothetical protein TRFO_27351 [Tritrichomonas foetus]|eukprot:OHT05031.1 hypothetical protein TRFO_27351 [Tritrichomonas foetus]
MTQARSQVTFAENAKNAELIQNIRDINNSLQEKEEHLILSQSPRKLTHLIQKTDNLFEQVSTPSAMSHDVETFRNITQIAVSQVSSVSLGPKSVNLVNVRSNLMSKYADNAGNLDFEKVGEWAIRNSRVAPTATSFLFGLGQFQPVHKERQKGARTQKDKIEELTAVDLKEVKENRTDTLMARARKLCEKLKKNGDTPLSNVITAPKSFAQTVENAFDLAHLVRDGRVGITSGNGTIFATASTEKMKTSETRRQCVLHLRQPEYKRILQESQDLASFQGDDLE